MNYEYIVSRRVGKKLTSAPGAANVQLLIEDENLYPGIADVKRMFGELSTVEQDLLVLAGAVFAADRASKRGDREELCRKITIRIPVFNIDKLLPQISILRQLLRDLSQDSWQIDFTQIGSQPPSEWPDDTTVAKSPIKGRTLLFSGGLDSLAAAVEYGHEPLMLISHVTRNNVTGRAQTQLADLLAKRGYAVEHSQFFVSSADGGITNLIHAVEPSQRTRSFVFLTLGAIAARRTGLNEIIFMAENGQMAIHLPLTSGRVGAFSTHTAHPSVLNGARNLFSTVMKSDLRIVNPYVYRTKAEIVQQVSINLPEAIALSTSCWKNTRVTVSGATHCGECIPCFIRRIAVEMWQPDPTHYGRDLWSEKVAELSEDDDGRRNIADLAEFIVRFRSMNTDDILCEFPELYSDEFSANEVVAMYRRFSNEATTVLARYPTLQPFLQ